MSEYRDKIFVQNLRTRAVIGTTPDERKDRQEIVISYSLIVNTEKAGRTDNIDDTVNYRTVSKKILTHVETIAFNLIEKVAEDVASICLHDRTVKEVIVTVEKPGCIRFADVAGVTIHRGKSINTRKGSRSP